MGTSPSSQRPTTWYRACPSTMSYRDFRLPEVISRFKLTTREAVGLFGDRAAIQPSSLLVEILRVSLPLAMGSGNEKARSEFLVTPVLTELKRIIRTEVSLFSGVELSVDAEAGLTGICDFVFSASRETLFVTAPVVTLVEAKNENLREGLGQCAAEMVAARLWNERAGTPFETISGVVTTGTSWMFLALSDSKLSIDLREYTIHEVDKILGILASMLPG